MKWTALVPIKDDAASKSRLAGVLSPQQRRALSDCMAATVLERLRNTSSVADVIVLSPHPRAGAKWIRDQRRGLNHELTAARAVIGSAPLLVIHADLPLLEVNDVEALLAAARDDGAAVAPDRHGLGTNALAIADGRAFEFAFGRGSLALHCARLVAARIVRRQGLETDVDAPDDLKFLPIQITSMLSKAANLGQ